MSELDSRYRIRAPLRCDGIGRLDCAEDLESGRRLAVRWLPLKANGDAAARACADLPSHPQLPRIRQTGQMGESAYVAMDFPEGRLLAALLDEPFDPETLGRTLTQIADALAVVHGQGVFHGELSAESILLVKPEKAFLWDMPLVIANRMTDRRGEERLMHQLARTAVYLSPERARGGPPTAAGDVYSLGVALCMAAGGRTLEGTTTLGLVHAVASGQWAPEVPEHLGQPLRGLLGRMISSDPAERPTASELASAYAPSIPTLREMPAISLPTLHDTEPALPDATASAVAAPAAVVAAFDDQEDDDQMPVVLGDLIRSEPTSIPHSVPLTENISVTPELYAAGAATLTEEQMARENARALKRKLLWLAAVMVALVLAGLGLCAGFAPAPVEVVALPIPRPAVERKAAVALPPAVAQPATDELLVPLGAKKLRGKARKSAWVAPVPIGRVEKVEAVEAPEAGDEPSDPEPVKAELKRPSL